MYLVSAIVEVKAATVGYGPKVVLHNINLSIARGEVTAILGANGSGKSTLIRSILGLVPLSRGSISLFGSEKPGRPEWRRVGYVPQRLGAGGGVPATVSE